MERLIEYFDRIKADEELKENTRSFIRQTIAANDEADLREAYQARKGKTVTRKFAMAAFPIAACFALIIGGYAFYKTPVEYISYDINPSLEFGLNYFGKVVEADGFNADGTRLLAECRIQGLEAEEAVKALTLQAKTDGYIKADGTTVIAMTVEAKRIQSAERLETMLRQETQSFLDEKGMRAVIYTDRTDLQTRTEAREYGLSPGKYKLIQMLGSLDPNMDQEQFRNARITDILLKADELMNENGNGQTDESKWNFNMIRETVSKIENAYQENETNRNQNKVNAASSSAISTEQNQEQNQNQTQTKSQAAGSGPVNQDQGQNGLQNSITSSAAIEQEQVQNQNQNQGDGQATSEQEQIQNQNTDNGSGSSDSSSSGQSTQDQSNGGSNSSPAENNKPN